MTSIMIGLHGLYLIVVGANGNVNKLMGLLSDDVKPFIPWIFAILVISLLSQHEDTKKLIAPFITLLALNFVLRNFETVKAEVNKIYSLSGV